MKCLIAIKILIELLKIKVKENYNAMRHDFAKINFPICGKFGSRLN